jgi:hypothetical protein
MEKERSRTDKAELKCMKLLKAEKEKRQPEARAMEMAEAQAVKALQRQEAAWVKALEHAEAKWKKAKQAFIRAQ